ncbi:MAG: peptidylprolyl isomerase [Muribaculaceae bacterium]|nr:peptidylprolyl isomerase [Muribaculaceae bacterium]
MKLNTIKSQGGKAVIAAMMLSTGATALNAKENKGVIMTVDGEEIPTSEFLYLFQKNNSQQVEPQTLDEYLDLFQVYRLKVAEAKQEGVDTTSNFKKEIRQYRRELLEPYITDTAFINNLVDIAMDREKTVLESSHIMFIRTHDEEKDKRSLEILDSLRQELLNGADFIELAKKYSQDKFSSEKGGYLGYTPAGTFPYGFETAEYETPEGEISDIVESHVGWHIIKSGARKPAEEFNHPVRSYDEIKADVLRKSSSPFDTRFFEIRRNNIENLKKKHPKMVEAIANLPEDEAYEVLIAEEEVDQYANNPEYHNLVDEYTNGSLLYEVSVKNVWDKASNDEEGLNDYYNANRANYTWDTPHAKGVLVQAVNDSVADVIRANVIGMSPDEVVKYVRSNFKKEATADKFNMAKGANAMVDNLMFGEAETTPKIKSFKTYFIVDGRIVDAPEELNDVKSLVVSDYQEQLENDWVNSLRGKHTVQINQKELKNLHKTLKKEKSH